MDKYILENSNGKDVKFTGELIADVASSSDKASSLYSGSPGRSKELRLFRTKARKYIGQIIEWTQWQGEKDRYYVKIFDDLNQLSDFFGYGWLAKRLYDKANIDVCDEVE